MPKARPIADRFWEHVNKSCHDECWIWSGNINGYGYGRIGIGGKRLGLAHRISWELHNGPIPDGLCVLHCCDVRSCVNPGHLFLGTRADNIRDMTKKGRQARGERRPQSKLSHEDAAEIRRKYKPRKYTQRMLALEYGVGQVTISQVITGKTWKEEQDGSSDQDGT